MILLTAITSAGPRLAVKTDSGISVLEHSPARTPDLPNTVSEALLTSGGFERVRGFVRDNAAALRKLAVPETEIQLGPLFTPRNVICIGLNYKDHAAEGGVALPEKPVVFAKLNGSIIGPNAPIVLPPETQQVDYEAELAVVIGRRCKGASKEDALNCVAGYTCLNDVSARDFQFGDNQWVRSKSQDTFGPMGPYLVTISFLSRGITLEPGDVISTGTPHGVGFARKPPIFLKAGDQVVVEIDGVGRLSNRVVAA